MPFPVALAAVGRFFTDGLAGKAAVDAVASHTVGIAAGTFGAGAMTYAACDAKVSLPWRVVGIVLGCNGAASFSFPDRLRLQRVETPETGHAVIFPPVCAIALRRPCRIFSQNATPDKAANFGGAGYDLVSHSEH